MGLSKDKPFTGNVGQASKSICPFMFNFLCGKRHWAGHMVFKTKNYFFPSPLLPGKARLLLPSQGGICGSEPKKPLKASCRNNWGTSSLLSPSFGLECECDGWIHILDYDQEGNRRESFKGSEGLKSS